MLAREKVVITSKTYADSAEDAFASVKKYCTIWIRLILIFV